jgi:hypothetical protein
MLSQMAESARFVGDVVAMRSFAERALAITEPLIKAGKPIALNALDRGLSALEDSHGCIKAQFIHALYLLGDYKEALTNGLAFSDIACRIRDDPDKPARSSDLPSDSLSWRVAARRLKYVLCMTTMILHGRIDSTSVIHGECGNPSCSVSRGAPEGRTLLACGGCRGWKAYCGRTCQKADWPDHKETCKLVLTKVAIERESIDRESVRRVAIMAVTALSPNEGPPGISVAGTMIVHFPGPHRAHERGAVAARVHRSIRPLLSVGLVAPAAPATAATLAATPDVAPESRASGSLRDRLSDID